MLDEADFKRMDAEREKSRRELIALQKRLRKATGSEDEEREGERRAPGPDGDERPS